MSHRMLQVAGDKVMELVGKLSSAEACAVLMSCAAHVHARAGGCVHTFTDASNETWRGLYEDEEHTHPAEPRRLPRTRTMRRR